MGRPDYIDIRVSTRFQISVEPYAKYASPYPYDCYLKNVPQKTRNKIQMKCMELLQKSALYIDDIDEFSISWKGLVAEISIVTETCVCDKLMYGVDAARDPLTAILNDTFKDPFSVGFHKVVEAGADKGKEICVHYSCSTKILELDYKVVGEVA